MPHNQLPAAELSRREKMQLAVSSVMYPSYYQSWLDKRGFKNPDAFLEDYIKNKLDPDEAEITTYKVPMVNTRGEACEIALIRFSPKSKILETVDSNIRDQHILHLVGRSDFYERRMDENMHLLRQGFTVWSFNFPGIMNSTGRYFELDDFIRAADATIDYMLQDCLVRSEQLLLFGNCTGSAVAIYALSDRQGIRCVYSNGISNAIAGLQDIAQDMQLGFLRAVWTLFKMYPIDYKHLLTQIMNRLHYDLRPDVALGTPGPFLQVIQRERDGVILDGSAYNVVKDNLAAVRAGTRLDDCPDEFLKDRDELWAKSLVRANPEKFHLRDLHRNYQKKSFLQKALPDPNAQMRIPNLPHYAPGSDCHVIGTDEEMVSGVVVDFARRSYKYLQDNPDARGTIPFKRIHAREVGCGIRNAFLASAPLIMVALYYLPMLMPQLTSDAAADDMTCDYMPQSLNFTM